MVGKEDDPFLWGPGNFSGAVPVKLWGGVTNQCFMKKCLSKAMLGGGFTYFLFSPLFGEDFQFD